MHTKISWLHSSGFSGHFTKKDNPQYKPNDARSGTKFLKAENITRADILVYDVRVVESSYFERGRKHLRAAVSSLKKLSEVCADVQTCIPRDLPASHREQGDTAAADDAAVLQYPLERNKLQLLRAELASRSLDTSGNKTVLVNRLREALEEAGEGVLFHCVSGASPCPPSLIMCEWCKPFVTCLQAMATERQTETRGAMATKRKTRGATRMTEGGGDPLLIHQRKVSASVTPRSLPHPCLAPSPLALSPLAHTH